MTELSISLMVDWEEVAELPVTDASFARVWNGRSGWSARMPFDREIWDLCQTGGQQNVGCGVIVYQNGAQWVGLMGDGYPLIVDGQTLEFAGISLLSTLARRVPSPNPSSPWATGGNEFHTVTEASTTAAWASFLNAQCGTGAYALGAAPRRLPPDWAFVAVAGGPAKTIKARWAPNLLELVETIGKGDEIDFDLALANQAVTATIRWKTRDGDPVAVLSPDLGDVESYRVGTNRSWKPVSIAGGKGEGASRPISASTITGAVPTIEEWFEASSAETAPEVQAAAIAHRIDRQQISQPLELVLNGSGQTIFGRDFQIGDMVLVDVPDLAMVKARVMEATTTVRGADVSTRVVVGSGVFDARMVPNFGVRIGRLEGR